VNAQAALDGKHAPRARRVDPVTFQVIGSGLVSICREMGTTMCRTAYSPIFVDGLDFSCGIMDNTGLMIAQAEYSPCHLNSMSYSASWAIMELGLENLRPGDVILHNDPYRGGTHLNDVNCIKPIFAGDELVAIAVNRAHQIDVGGKARAGFAGDATDLFSEGLIIPPVKWWSAGIEDSAITEIFCRNVRQPYVQRADLGAQLASCYTAERRILALCEKYGRAVVLDCFEDLKDYAEQRMRAEIEDMPDGTYGFCDFADDDGINQDPIRIEATVTIRGDELTVDFTGSGAQVTGPMNATYGITSSAVWNAIMQVTSDPTIPINQGRFRPVRIVAPRGSILNAQDPRPTMGGNAELHIRICETVMGCFVQAMPERVIAACYGCVNNFTGGALDPTTGKFWLYYFYSAGGWGARATKDGWDDVYHQAGNALDYPIEVLESQLPIRYWAKRLSEGYAGAGTFRGGFGATRVIEVLARSEINAVGERHKFGGWGIYGGRPARPNAILLKRKGDEDYRPLTAFGARSLSKFSNVPVEPGDRFALVQSGGGGYGHPAERDAALVLRDLEDELITIEEARDTYGMVTRRDGWDYSVDSEATAALRRELLQQQTPNMVKGCIALDDALYAEWSKSTPAPPLSQAEDAVIGRARDSIDGDACRTQCVKAGSEHRCPYHNAEALSYWSVDNLRQWTKNHCPQREAVLPHFPLERIYE
jgi:N-methylhydantoinase B/oxoprolinase/acetone carboxylase alpha subunit